MIGSFHQGGSERQAVGLTRLLQSDATFDVFAATLNKEGVLLSELAEMDIPEFKLTSFYNPNFVKQVRRCAAYLTENEIDIVHTHDFYTNIFGMAAAAFAGVPVRIASKRETGGMRTRSQEIIEKIAFGRADAIVVNAAAVRTHLIERSITENKIKVIYNGLDLTRFSEQVTDCASTARRFHLPADANVKFVTLVANLRHSVKNVPMFLKTAKRVIRKCPDAHFVIAGEGELEAELRTLASELGVADHSHFIGRCTDVPALLSLSEVCVLSSSNEGFSNSILEYMAAEKAVVATNVGGAGEAIVHGETGYLVAADDDDAMAGHLIELLTDRNVALEMGNKGKKRIVDNFSANAQLEKILELYSTAGKK